MAQDLLQASKETYQDFRDHYQEMRQRRLEDLQFSNPEDPKQWPDQVRQARENSPGGSRPCLTFDHTNQFINQVVNDGRQNKPSISVLPVDSSADVKTAQALEGLIRQIEDVSRAPLAYDTSLDHSVRCGIGWIRVVTQMMNADLNEQEIRIKSVVDPLTCMISPDSVELDGSDASEGFIETTMSKKAFERTYGAKASQTSWDAANPLWFGEDMVRVCERYYQVKGKKNCLVVQMPNGQQQRVGEDEYWGLVKQLGFQPIVVRQYMEEECTVKWLTMSGAEILDETEIPSPWIPLVPVYGDVLWIEGKRYICGLTRKLMDGQRAKNYERSAAIEMVALQPKAPWIVAAESVAQYQEEWENANNSNKAYLPYDALSADGEMQFPAPQRMAPPPMPATFIQGAQLAVDDMQAAVGMYKSNLGAPSNAVSGRAKLQDQREGDTATYHYLDHQRCSIEHVGRIVVKMIPKIYDTQREARILGMNGDVSVVRIDPEGSGYQQDGDMPVISPQTGTYDVRVKAGPSYTTQRQEASAALTEIVTRSPNLMPVLGPMWARMQDWPEAEKVSKLLLAMAPPAVQAVEQGDSDLPPAAQAQIVALQQQLQQAQQQIQQLSQMADEGQRKMAYDHEKLELERYDAETKRITALKPPDPGMTPEQIQLLVLQMFGQMAQRPQEPMELPEMGEMQPEEQPIQPPGMPPAMAPPGPAMQ